MSIIPQRENLNQIEDRIREVQRLSNSINNNTANLEALLQAIYDYINAIGSGTPHSVQTFTIPAGYSGLTPAGAYSVSFYFYDGGSGAIDGHFVDSTHPAITFTADSFHRREVPSIFYVCFTGSLRINVMYY